MTCSLIWRRGYLESISNTNDEEQKELTRAEIKWALGVRRVIGGHDPDAKFANMRSVSIFDLFKSNIGTRVDQSREGDKEIWRISEDGKPLAVVEQRDDVVKVTLADGTTVNRPFATAEVARSWVLSTYSRNLIYKGTFEEDEDTSFDPAP